MEEELEHYTVMGNVFELSNRGKDYMADEAIVLILDGDYRIGLS